VHPDCQLDISIALADERRAEWGIKILGAYVGSDEYVVNALRCKMVSIRELTQIMLYYPNAQAKYYLHRFCYNAKINYWTRAQFPKHVAPFVDDFKEQQQKLIASYHEIHDGKEFNHDRRHFDDLYQRVALPIEKDGMALNNVVFVSLTAFACSIAASMKDTLDLYS